MIIFVDFDGVLTHKDSAGKWYPAPPEVDEYGTARSNAWYNLDPRCIAVLNKLVAVTDAKVVISSFWRKRFSLVNLENHMKTFGFTGEVIGKTPHKMSLYWRDEEINLWMVFNNYTDDYIVLDDERYHLLKTEPNNFVFIKHGWRNGGLTSNRAKWELTRVLRKRGIVWEHSF